jgi:hypothetical protein
MCPFLFRCGRNAGIRTLDLTLPKRARYQAALHSVTWRREWDSNPRDAFTPTRFRGELLRPLGHLSTHGDIRI